MFNLRRIALVAKREILTRTNMKSYRITLLVQVLIVGLLALSPVLYAKFTGDNNDGPEVNTIAFVDSENANTGNALMMTLQTLGEGDSASFELSAVDTEEQARQMVDDGDADAAVITTRTDGGPEFTIVTGDGDPQGALAQVLTIATSALSTQERIDSAGLSQNQMQEIFEVPTITLTDADPAAAGEEDSGTNDAVNYVIAYGGTILIFVFVVMFGQWIAQGVVEEKASRIMEIMLNAATPRELLTGKIIGIMVTAIVQFAPMLLVAGFIASNQKRIGGWLDVPEDRLFNIDLGAIAWSSIGWFSLYFMLGFLLFGALYAGVGSLVSRQEEVGTAVAPMTTVMMIGYFAALGSLANPDGVIAKASFLFPGTSVFVAMVRILLGNPSKMEIALSIGLLLLAIVLAALLAARLYRVGVLMYGQPPKFSALFKLGNMQEVAR